MLNKIKNHLDIRLISFLLANILFAHGMVLIAPIAILSFMLFYPLINNDASQTEFIFRLLAFCLIMVFWAILKFFTLPIYFKIANKSKITKFVEFFNSARSNNLLKMKVLITTGIIDLLLILAFAIFTKDHLGNLQMASMVYLVFGLGLFGSYLFLFLFWGVVDFVKAKRAPKE